MIKRTTKITDSDQTTPDGRFDRRGRLSYIFNMRNIFRFIVLSILITAIFTSAFAQIRDRGMRVGVSKEDVAKKSDVNLYAVLIGVSRYKLGDKNIDGNQIPNLKNATDDAAEIAKFLRSPEGGSFPESNVKVLLDEQATKAEVEKALNGLLASKPNDYFVIYIAAHGVVPPGGDQTPYFILHDSDPRTLSQSGLKMEYFKQIVSKIPAQKGLVISDTCHSEGVLLDKGQRGLFVTQQANSALIDEMKKIPRGIGYLSAASATESSYERDELGHGVFTHCLLEAVRGNADVNSDGMVTFDEMRNYIRDEVPKFTDNKQHPVSSISSVAASSIPISVVTYPELGKCGGANPCGTLRIVNPEVDGVTVSIDDKSIGALSSGGQRTIRVPAGMIKLTLSKGTAKQTQQAEIAANKTTSYEVNAAFSSSDSVSISDTPQQKVINLDDEVPPKKEAEQIFQQGVEQFNKQKLPAAIELFNKAISANGGGYHQALVYRGRAQQSLGLKKDAIASFLAAVQLRPTDYQTKTLLAEAQFNDGGEITKIVSDLTAITKRYPKYDFAWVVLGDVLFARGDRMAAERALRKAIAINPKFPPAHMILANVLMYKSPQAKMLEGGVLKNADALAEAVTHAKKAYDLFEEIATKMRSLTSGTAYKKTAQFFSISYLLFGGGRYADEAALAEVNYILGKAYTRIVGFDDGSMTDAQHDNYLNLAGPRIQTALQLSRKTNDKFRTLLVQATNADYLFLKGDSKSAKKEAMDALKIAESMPNAELTDIKFDLMLNLYLSHSTDQEYGKAYDYLNNGLKLISSRLEPDDLARYKDMLRESEDKMKANRKKK